MRFTILCLIFLTFGVSAANLITNSNISASANIALSKLAALSASIVPVSDGSGKLTSSSTTATELSYVHNVTSAIQTQIDGKQSLDGTLTALAAHNTNGLLTQTAADTFTGRTLTGPAAGISVSNGDGVSGNPTLALANDLAALEALSGTNTIYYRSASDTWTAVTVGSGLSFSGGSLTASGGSQVNCYIFLTGGNGYGSTNTKIRRFTTTVKSCSDSSVTYADSATAGASFTIATAGTYCFGRKERTANADYMGFSLNSASLTTDLDSITNADRLGGKESSSDADYWSFHCGYFALNDVIRPHSRAGSVSTANADVFMYFVRVN